MSRAGPARRRFPTRGAARLARGAAARVAPAWRAATRLAAGIAAGVAGLAAGLAAGASSAEAQFPRPVAGGEPAWWLGAGVGITSPGEVRDGRTASTWRFGEELQYRASVERPLGGGASLGATVAYVRAPLTYTSDRVVPVDHGAAPCAQCDAEADVWSLLASFHAGGGTGFHQVFDLTAGVTRFMNFRRTDGGGELPPEGDDDFAFSIGYGFGYGLSPRAHVVLVQDFGFLLHQREGLAGGDRSLVRQQTTRVGLRIGAGARR